MDFNKELLDSLRAKGYEIGTPHIQDGKGLCVPVNSVPLPIRYARLLDQGRATIAEIVADLSKQ